MPAITRHPRPGAPRYLEDFKVGDLTETSGFAVTRDMILSFAEQYDPQPMHLDETAARDTVFGELVGSGWQTLAVTMRLLLDARLLGGTPIVGAELRDIRFMPPCVPETFCGRAPRSLPYVPPRAVQIAGSWTCE